MPVQARPPRSPPASWSWRPSSRVASRVVPYVLDVQNGSASSDLEDILSCTGGPQAGSLTLGTATNWYMVLATFRPLATGGLILP